VQKFLLRDQARAVSEPMQTVPEAP
jgi:hypothetical protein